MAFHSYHKPNKELHLLIENNILIFFRWAFERFLPIVVFRYRARAYISDVKIQICTYAHTTLIRIIDIVQQPEGVYTYTHYATPLLLNAVFFFFYKRILTVQNIITGSSSRTDTIVVLNERFRYVEKRKCQCRAVSARLFITRKHRNEKRNNK
jgi:hypothetical protein